MGNFVIPKTTSSPTVPAGGTFGQILAKTNEFDFNTQWINPPSLTGYVPYIGATQALNLGAFSLTANSIIKNGGTSSQYLMADGSTSLGFVLPTLTSGSVLFSNGTTIAQDNANFFWDDTNNRLGIGTATPAVTFDVTGIGRITNGARFNNVGIAYGPWGQNPLEIGTNGSHFIIQATNGGNTSINSVADLGAKLGIKAGGAASTDIALRIRNSGNTGDLITIDGTGKLNFSTPTANTVSIQGSGNGDFFINSTAYGPMISSSGSNYTFNQWGTNVNFIVGTGGAPDRLGYNMTFKAGISTGNTNGGDFQFFSSGSGTAGLSALNTVTEVLRIKYNGNVGIGTTAPNANLQIGNGSTGAINLYIGGAIGSDQTIGFNVNSNSVYHNIVSNASTGEFRFNAGVTGGGHFLTFRTGGNTERMRITSAGNVGIGNIAPGFPLVVGTNSAGTGSDFSVQTSSTAAKLTLSSQSAAMSFGASPQGAYTNGVPPGASFGSTSAGSRTTVGCLLTSAGGGTYVNFSTNGAASGFHITHNFGADLVTVLSNNNFGIGIAAPVAIFQVKTTTANTNSSIAFLNNNGIATIGTITDTGSALTMLQFRADGINFTDLGTNGIVIASTGYALSANATAILDVRSTTKGFLPPRMTTLQKIGITLPAAGLVIYDTNLNKLCVFTTAWETITSV